MFISYNRTTEGVEMGVRPHLDSSFMNFLQLTQFLDNHGHGFLLNFPLLDDFRELSALFHLGKRGHLGNVKRFDNMKSSLSFLTIFDFCFGVRHAFVCSPSMQALLLVFRMASVLFLWDNAPLLSQFFHFLKGLACLYEHRDGSGETVLGMTLSLGLDECPEGGLCTQCPFR